jgi:2-polyprenyl-6-hydroxyphenyl methylase/3-demethylubiquinone-9 3-methyltransferase
MFKSDSSVPEYGWKDACPTDAHVYLWPVLLDVIKGINIPAPKIFDAGCGNGFLAGQLLMNGYKVSGCDASVLGVNAAIENYPKGNFEVASVYDNLEQRFGADWDIVISSEVVEHLYNPRLFAENLFKMIKPGGYLVISTPYHGYMKNLAIASIGKFDNHFTALWDGGHIKFWSYSTLKMLLKEQGFCDFCFFGAGRFPFYGNLW